MKLPCQTIVWDVLPAIRAAIAEELVKLGCHSRKPPVCLDMAPSAIRSTFQRKEDIERVRR
jgi:predicted transcriptional regulator